ncbi:hypothetical protein SAY87_015555 [Trapa incisa]|uniref:RNA-dependent RNA polymerase n=1 Tax=Trapa incisa TaxID=236973 RepID=A0AAN7QTQ8_9MYRT|nr:hypothetical protein SAY87_015555 [Trapa incisa]
MGKTIRVYGFPLCTSAEMVKEFLESSTGDATVSAVEIVRNPHMTYHKVKFTTLKEARSIISMANKGLLMYRGTYLKAHHHHKNILLPTIDNLVLYFGCPLSKDRFSALWRTENASVKFDSKFRKLYFFFSHKFVDYKLELFFENIWKMKMHQPDSQASKFLVIQLLGSPRIFNKATSPTNQWTRDVDFTEFGYIGQSSALCLELQLCSNFSVMWEYLGGCEMSEEQFIIEKGVSYSYSSKLDLVPIVKLPKGVHLPYEITFKVNSLVQQGYLSGPTLGADFFKMVDPLVGDNTIECILHALEEMSQLRDCCTEPVGWLSEQYRKHLIVHPHVSPSPRIFVDDGLVYVHKVQITPSKIIFLGPEVNMSNRVLRHYAGDIENFLRVSFLDEELGKLHSADLCPRSGGEKRTKLYERILSTLRDGIVIGNKKFEFLAFSSSQLRDGSVWMFASREGLSAADIRKWMGDFSNIRNVAKYAARLGQSFGSSREVFNIEEDEIEIIPDIVTAPTVTQDEKGSMEYVFSDGIGKISVEFARQVATKCRIANFIPSAFQIRYGGFKGVVAVDPTSPVMLSLRKSMSKYPSSNTKLDVLAWTRYHPCFLNRQVITLLSTLGVKDHTFEMKQEEAVAQLDSVLTDSRKAGRELEVMYPGGGSNSGQILKEMLSSGYYKPDGEPFLSRMLRTFCAAKLLELRTKTRIFIPKGRSLMGCLDETGILEYGQVFVQFSNVGSSFADLRQQHQQVSSTTEYHNYSHRLDGIVKKKLKESREIGAAEETQIFQGKVVVARNPCLHPGDVRVLQAVDVPALHHMVDCIVFPQKGMRPHPNECSGGDLDGDLYFVSWDPDLIPPRQFPPMDYTPAPAALANGNVTIEDVTEFFAEYMINDNLGIISNAHTVFADKEPSKACSKACVHLAKLHSLAVDFAKTGIPALIPPYLRVKKFPDFTEKADSDSYKSTSVMGKLFRKVKDIGLPSTDDAAGVPYDLDMEVDGYENYVDEASNLKSLYDGKLRTLMDYYGIKTEAEILMGCALTKSRSFDKRRDLEGMGFAARSLRQQARLWFFDDMGNSTVSSSPESFPKAEAEDLCAKASAWYHVTYHPKFWAHSCEDQGKTSGTGNHFLSFPWCVYDWLLHIKRERLSTQMA